MRGTHGPPLSMVEQLCRRDQPHILHALHHAANDQHLHHLCIQLFNPEEVRSLRAYLEPLNR